MRKRMYFWIQSSGVVLMALDEIQIPNVLLVVV